MVKTTLRIVNDGRRAEYDLDHYSKQAIVVGRGSDNDIVVQNNRISHNHGCFFKENNNWFYQDLTSTNGSYVNGMKITKVEVNNGDKIYFTSHPKYDSPYFEIVQKKVKGVEPVVNKTTPSLSEKQFGIFQILSAVCYAILALLGAIQIIRFLVLLGNLNPTRFSKSDDSGAILILVVLGICYTIYVVGLGVLAYGLFFHKRKLMKDGANALAAGFAGLFIAISVYLLIVSKGNIAYIFYSGQAVALLISMILTIVAFFLQRRNFIKYEKGELIGNAYIYPAVCYVIADALLLIILSSINQTITYGIGIDFSGAFSGGIIRELVYIAAMVLTGLFIHENDTVWKK